MLSLWFRCYALPLTIFINLRYFAPVSTISVIARALPPWSASELVVRSCHSHGGPQPLVSGARYHLKYLVQHHCTTEIQFVSFRIVKKKIIYFLFNEVYCLCLQKPKIDRYIHIGSWKQFINPMACYRILHWKRHTILCVFLLTQTLPFKISSTNTLKIRRTEFPGSLRPTVSSVRWQSVA